MVLVLDHERLYIDFQRDLPKETAIVRLPKSGGVSISYQRHVFTRLSICCLQTVVRSREFRKRHRDDVVREYFYGKKRFYSYFPFSFEVPFSQISIYKIGGMKLSL